MSIVYFTLVAALLYLLSDWVLQRAEVAVGRVFQYRSLLFFAILLTGVRAQVLEREKNARWVNDLLVKGVTGESVG